MAETLQVNALRQEDFAPFGDVIEFAGNDFYPINGGMADRYHGLARVDTGDGEADAVVSLVSSRQYDLPRRVDHLENHPHGSQAFIPLDSTPFIVVVGVAAEIPDPGQLRAFVTDGQQGINYRAGTWHHVLLTPFAPMRFVCVDRDSPNDNCIDFHIPAAEQPLLELP